MNEITLEAMERADGKFKEKGFIPGVLYGDGIEAATSVKFDEKALNKLIASQGPNAKLWVNFNKSKKFGFIKEVQRKYITRTVIHVDVQIVSKDHEIKMQIPICYKGEQALQSKQLQLQVHQSEVTALGKMALMPDVVDVDVSEMKLGDTVTLTDLGLNKLLKIENEEPVYATVTKLRIQHIETEETAETEETGEAEKAEKSEKSEKK